MNLRKELILMIRGYFLTPVIATLAKKNFFKKDHFKTLLKKKEYQFTMNYLCNLNLLKKSNNTYKISKKGKKVFFRSGSFNIANSYKDYIFQLEKILDNQNILKKLKVDRPENILGSSSTNYRKFFKKIIDDLNKSDFDIIHDLGCGEGKFLNEVKKKFKKKILTGSDISKISVQNAKKKYPFLNKNIIQSDAQKINKWGNWLIKKYNFNKKILLSMWFVIHEFSENKPQKIINYFKKIHKKFPNSKILLGEIVKPDKKILEKNFYNSILPEYIFFHEMSGQGILTYKELKFVLKKIPYKCKKQINIDVISYKNKKNPSGIIWILEPK